MADNTTLNTGTGGDVIATDDIGGVKVQRVKPQFGADGSATDVSSANPLPVVQIGTPGLPTGASTAAKQPALGTAGSASVDVLTVQGVTSMTPLKTDGSGTTQPVSAASLPLPSGAATSAKQPALGTAGSAAADVISVQGVASMTALKVDGSGVTQPVSGTVTASGPLTDTQLRASAVPVSGTVTASGPLTDTQLRATAVPVSLATAPSTPVTNAGTFAVQIAANSGVNAAQVAGTATAVNAGTNSAGVQRVTLATDQTTLTNTLGNVGLVPVTAGGNSVFHLVSAATTNATNVKASAGQLYGWYIYNSNAAARKVAFHNTAGTPTAGASVLFSIVIPPTSAANVADMAIAFSTGIAITTVTDLTDAGTTAVAASDLIINLFYK